MQVMNFWILHRLLSSSIARCPAWGQGYVKNTVIVKKMIYDIDGR